MQVKVRSTNVFQQPSHITRKKRGEIVGGGPEGSFHGCCVWFTGLSGAGKTTVSFGTEDFLCSKGYASYSLDGDNIRTGEEERSMQCTRANLSKTAFC